MDELLLPVMILLLASIFQGTFGLGMKYVKPLAWEAWWIVHATIAMVLLPLAWAFLVIPDLINVLAAAPSTEVIQGAILGAAWGVGGILFGKSVGYIGMSLTYGIVMGLCSIAGALISLVMNYDKISSASIPYSLLGLALLAIAVIVVTIAGLKRDKMMAESGDEIEGIAKGSAFKTGLIIAAVSGIMSAMLAIGFDSTKEIGQLAIDAGAEQRNSALARWVVVLGGAYILNASYAIYLLTKNKSWGSFKEPGMFGQALKWAIIAAILWFAALGTYGQAVALLGDIGTMVGWPVMLGLSLVVSNIVAVFTGEWKGFSGPLKLVGLGVIIITVATVLMTYASTL